jgi:hypothetical protein
MDCTQALTPQASVCCREGEGGPAVRCGAHPICRRQMFFPASATIGVEITGALAHWPLPLVGFGMLLCK